MKHKDLFLKYAYKNPYLFMYTQIFHGLKN